MNLLNKNKILNLCVPKELRPPQGQKGIYFLINKNEIVYIGSSFKDMRKRIRLHSYKKNWFFDKLVTLSYLDINICDLLLQEAKYIKKYQPRYNIEGVKRKNPIWGLYG